MARANSRKPLFSCSRHVTRKRDLSRCSGLSIRSGDGSLASHQYAETPKSWTRLASLRSNVATASYRFAAATAAIAASARDGSGSGQTSSTRFHGQSSTTRTPGKLTTSRIIEVSRSPAMAYSPWRTYVTSKTTNCGTIATRAPSSACWRRAFAAASCVGLRAVKYETRTFASMRTLRTSDTPSAFPRFLNCLDGVVGAAFHGTFPTPQPRALGRYGDAASPYVP